LELAKLSGKALRIFLAMGLSSALPDLAEYQATLKLIGSHYNF
jgi:hypothetical protein